MKGNYFFNVKHPNGGYFTLYKMHTGAVMYVRMVGEKPWRIKTETKVRRMGRIKNALRTSEMRRKQVCEYT